MPGRRALVAATALSIVAACGAGAASDAPRNRTTALVVQSPALEAEAMALSPASAGTVFADGGASSGAAQLVWSNGTLSGSTTVPAPATQIVVRALGDQCGGAPLMVVRVDGATVGTVRVRATAWTDYPMNVAVAPGTHAVEVAFTNDFLTAKCDRNLRVDRVGFGSASTPPATRDPVKLGTAVNHWHLFDASEPAYAATVEREFDSITAEYEMKMDQVLPTDAASYDFSLGDQLLAYAVAHGKQLRGHTLIWYRALPTWMTSRPWTHDELLAFLQSYVTAVVSHYRGQVAEWDVVNEAFNDDGTYRSSIWYDVIGPGYIDAAFQAARAADPGARLYYNDYGAEWQNAKSDAVLTLAARLRSLGVLDGVGFQSHFTASWHPSRDEFAANLARFAATGVDVGVTEMDVAMGGATGSPAQVLDQQAAIYDDVATACEAQPACKRFTVWGVTDKYTWLSASDEPLLFDAAYAAKPARDAVAAALGR